MEARYDNTAASTTETHFKPTQPSPGSSHAMVNSNVIPMQQTMSNNSGHHSAMGIQNVHANETNKNNMWVPNNSNQSMINNHNGMIS